MKSTPRARRRRRRSLQRYKFDSNTKSTASPSSQSPICFAKDEVDCEICFADDEVHCERQFSHTMDSLPVIEHACSSGEGFPYAPEDFPSPGDVWTWRVGKRCTHDGFWRDRSLHPPDRLQSSTGKKKTFNGRASLEQYIQNTFPDADVGAFFSSFVWRIPCTNVAKGPMDCLSRLQKGVRHSRASCEPTHSESFKQDSRVSSQFSEVTSLCGRSSPPHPKQAKREVKGHHKLLDECKKALRENLEWMENFCEDDDWSLVGKKVP